MATPEPRECDVADLLTRAQELLNKGLLEKAHGLCVGIIQVQPNHADAYFLLSVIAGSLGSLRQAIQLAEKAISSDGSSSEYFAQYSKYLFLANRFSDSNEALRRSIELGQETAPTCDTIGTLLSKFGDYHAAVNYFEKAVKLNPSSASYHFNLGAAHKALGTFECARRAYSTALKLQPDFHAARAALSEIGEAADTTTRLESLKQRLDSKNIKIDEELLLCNAIAREYASVGDHQQSFKFLRRGNVRKANSIDDQSEQDDLLFEAARSVRFNRPGAKRNLTRTPIFIVGMPRSGTTLVDRILSNHPQVTSAGELPVLPEVVKNAAKSTRREALHADIFGQIQGLNLTAVGDEYLRESRHFVHQETPFFVDKLPLNFWYTPLIIAALPEAKVICLSRDPLDVCIGNYKALFSLGSPQYNYSFDLMNTARYVQNFRKLMRRWKTELGERFLTVEYEDLVGSPKFVIERLLEYCELPWEEKCVDIQSNVSPVATASSVQVRQSINSNSVGRWKKYHPYMGEVERYFERCAQ